MEGATGSAETPRPEQELDAPQVDPRFESVRSEGMPEYVRVDRLRQVCGLPSVPADVRHARVVMGRVRGCRERARGAASTAANTAVATAGVSVLA